MAILLWVATVDCYSQHYNEPGLLTFNGYSIGQHVDTNLYELESELYFPNYLDGFNLTNCMTLPKKLKGLPIAIWKLKSNEDVTPNLIGDQIMKVIISGYSEHQKDSLIAVLTREFAGEPTHNVYEEKHPLQPYVTPWDLYTWETDSVIVQIGSSYLKRVNHPYATELTWNLIYTDLRKEVILIEEYRKKQ